MAGRRITRRQRDEFVRDGYLIIPSVVDRHRVDTALQAINHWLDAGFDSSERTAYHARSFAPDLCSDRVIVSLLTESGAFELASDLVGRPLVTPDSGQIALRFPVASGAAASPPSPHLDGVATATNGVPADGRIHGFTLLAGILLSDLPEPGHGNFTVWPGTHMAMASWLAEHGTTVREPDAFFRANGEIAARTSRPVAVTGHAGDLVLAHYLLLHATGAHSGPAIRYAVFFRLRAEGRDGLGVAVLTDAWTEWDAIAP